MSNRKISSTNLKNEQFILESCDLTYSVYLIGGRWKLLILCHLQEGKHRFSEIRNLIPGITERMLTLQLKEMEKDGLVKRTVYAAVPPHVDYRLTDLASELIPIWDLLTQWGNKHRKAQKSSCLVVDTSV